MEKRAANWSALEVTALVNAVTSRIDTIRAKFSTTVTSKKKEETWGEILNQ